MLKHNDVIDGLCEMLSKSFKGYKCYTEEIKQGFKRPSFFIQYFPITSNNFNIYYREQNILVDISYYSEEEKDLQSNFNNMEMANKLQNVLNTDIKVLDRNLNLQELSFDTVDRILHTTFNLIWYNENEVTQAYLDQFVLMQHFTVSLSEGIEYCYFVTSNGEVFRGTDEGFYVRCTDEEIANLRDMEFIKI